MNLEILLGAGVGMISGMIITILYCYVRWHYWQQQATAELEDRLQQHTFELQITLEELAEKNRQLEQQSMTDALSGAYNRAYFDKKIQAELKRSRREQRPLAILLLDIDHFKQINDLHGHLAGDQVIRQVAALIRQCLKRDSDKLCRYGGEEFAVLLPNTDLNGAFELAEQIRSKLSEQPLHVQNLELAVQISAGCYAATATGDSDADQYVGFADTALYQAKNAGRNQVHRFPPNAEPSQLCYTGTENEL